MQKRKTRFPGVYRLPDGRWWVRATAVTPLGRRRDTSVTLPRSATEEAAVATLARLRDTLLRETTETKQETRETPTVADYAERWLEAKAQRVRPSVAANYTAALSDRILPRLGEVRLDALTRADVDAWVAWAEVARKPPRQGETEGERYAKETVQGWWRVFCGMARDAAAEYGLKDPTFRVRAPAPRVPKRREGRTLTAAELGELLEQVERFSPARYAEVFALSFTGMRAGELFALRWDDVDEVRQRILIRRAVWRGIEDQPKTGESRELALPSALAEVLREHRRGMVVAQHRGLKTGLVFPSDHGTSREPASLHKPLALAAEAAGIEVRVTPQVLRRTFNTLMVLSGVDRIVLRSQMGHSSEEMTRRYAGVDLSAKSEAVARLLSMAGQGECG
jgi:integrase